MKKEKEEPISVLAALLGVGLVFGLAMLVNGQKKRKRTYKQKPLPIVTEDLGYAEEVKDQKLLMPPTSDDFIASDRFKDEWT